MIKITTLTRIRDNLHAGYREGDIWELIPSQWFDNWKRLVCFDCLDLFDENVSQPVSNCSFKVVSYSIFNIFI